MKHPVTRIRKRRKKQVVDAFGGKCQLCGYDKCVDALCFHHTDPSIKEYNPTTIINQWKVDRSIQQLINEKVILLCANCHYEIHSEDYDHTIQLEHNPIVNQKCEVCDKSFFTTIKKDKNIQKLCSSECSAISRRKVNQRPTKEELELLLQKHSYVVLGKIYGVSDNAVRKWWKKYNIID
jgi:hypothetical protein